MTKYVVTAPYVTLKVKDQAGATVLGELYQGAPVPENADPENVQRLLDKGMVAVVGTAEADLMGVPAGTPIPGEPPNVPVTEQSGASITPADRMDRAMAAAEQSEKTDADAEARKSGRPHGNASEDKWRDYAVSRRVADGVSEEDARAEVADKTKAELVAEYGG
jgi:hypothetical protein